MAPWELERQCVRWRNRALAAEAAETAAQTEIEEQALKRAKREQRR